MGRQFIFKNYWWIAPLGGAVGIALVVIFRTGQTASLVASIIAVALGFCYFAQRQKLAEVSLFKELFTEFNHQFDDMNGPLREIAGSSKPPDQSARETIINYFNLCSEEYLFFKEGYIHREVWRAWCAGMLLYLEREPFRSAWEDEERTGSYYGLCLDVIRGERPNSTCSIRARPPCPSLASVRLSRGGRSAAPRCATLLEEIDLQSLS